jgi:hypothetical protein
MFLAVVTAAASPLLVGPGWAFADDPDPADLVVATGGGTYAQPFEDPADVVAATGGGTYAQPFEDPADMVAATGGGTYPQPLGPSVDTRSSPTMLVIAILLTAALGALAILAVRRRQRLAIA